MTISKKTPFQVALMVLMVYAMSRQSWGAIIPGQVWMMLLGIACLTLFLYCVRNLKKKLSLFEIESVLLIIVVLFSNNYNLKNGSYIYETFFCATIFFSIFGSRHGFWMSRALKTLQFFSYIFAVLTIISFISSSFYYSVIYPFITGLHGTRYMTLSNYYCNGFTRHYSFNGMYVALAVCIAFGMLVPCKNRKKQHKMIKMVIALSMVVALLLTNKRAHILFTGAGAFFAYYLYNSDKKMTRIVKIAGLLIIACISGYILYAFIPNAFGFLERFQATAANDDVTSGRLDLWANALMMSQGKFVFGTGWYSYYNRFGIHTHNVYVQLLTETGIVGLIVFLLHMSSCFVKTCKLIVNSRKGKVQLFASGEQLLIVALIYQTFFLLYCFTGTCLYEASTLIPYIIFCTIGEYCWNYQMQTIER